MPTGGEKFEQLPAEANAEKKPEDLILSNEQYKETPFAVEGKERFYLFEIKSQGKKIMYFGSPHTNDPSDPVFEEIQKRFDEMKPEIVYVEGWSSVNKNKQKVREVIGAQDVEDAKMEGEPHFVIKLAVDAGADFESPEPDFSAEIAHLLGKGFSKKEIFQFNMYRVIDQYQRQYEDGDIEGCKKYLEAYFHDFRRHSGWEQAELDSLENDVIAELDIDDKQKYNSQVDPIPWDGVPQTVINEVSRSSSDFRDRHIFSRIAEGLKTYNKIFVVYGSAHAVKQEPALRALLEKSNI